MVKGISKKEWKANYFVKLENALRNHSKFLLVNADNVRSKQFAEIRRATRSQGEIIMGKNTMMKKCIKNLLEQGECLEYERVMPALVENVGFVFTNGDLKELREALLANKVAAPAKAGALAPVDVIVPAQNTGLGPEKTSFFQALGIPTKIARGTIEISSDVHLLKPGDKVGMSEATLLQMLKIHPFSYGLTIVQCFEDGCLFDPFILDVTEDDIRKKFLEGVQNIASVSLNIGYPTVASAPHSIANAFKNLLAVAAATEISFKEAEELKYKLDNPDEFAQVAQVVQVEEAKEESAAEGDDDSSSCSMGFDLFG
jgi:large subunit ribosomal protein LP0